MKRYVLPVGGSGARVAEALLCAACAGVFQADELHVLLADTDHRGSRSAELLRAKYADYARMQQLCGQQEGAIRPFGTRLTFRAWPEALPEDAATLADMTSAMETDALLRQALFDREASALDLREGFHGRRMLGQVIFAGLLEASERNAQDALRRMLEDMCQAVALGEEVRVVLVGSVCGGTGAAGIPMLSRHIREKVGEHVRMGAVLLAANGDHEDPAAAKAALPAFADETACDAVCVLGLPMSSCSSAPADYAHLTDWLAVYSMDVLLHRPQWLHGAFTVKAPEGVLSWDVFGKAANRYRLAYGRLVKAASAWVYVFGPQVDRRLRRPFFLRDQLFGWYAHFFRSAKDNRQAHLEDAAGMTRLMSVVLLWLGGLMRTLPPEMRFAGELSRARAEAQAHYEGLIALISHRVMLDEDAQKDESYEQGIVYRGDAELGMDREQTMKRIDAVDQEIARRSAEQEHMNRHIGGAAAIRLLQEALERAETECAELQARYEEANRRIDHAERIASQEDMYRITDARTKLERMVKHQRVLQERLDRIRADAAAAGRNEQRFARPAVAGAAEADGMFNPALTGNLLMGRRISRNDIERLWDSIVLPEDGVPLKQALRQMKRMQPNPESPVTDFVSALMRTALKEGGCA